MIRQPVAQEVYHNVRAIISAKKFDRDLYMAGAIEELNGKQQSTPNVAIHVDETTSPDEFAYDALRLHLLICHLENSIREGR